MGHLGDFGTERPANDSTFGYFGTTIRVHPDLSDLALVELAKRITSLADTDGAEQPDGDEHAGQRALTSVSGLVEMIVHPDDADEFWRAARANRQQLEDVVTLAANLIGASAGRPTRLPSGSSDGQTTTATSSTDGSSLPALRLLEGRPDLQLAVIRAEEAHAV